MLRKYSLYLAWVTTLLGVLGSLYFSEFRHMEPCHLCWYQRMSLYPLALILGVATYEGFFAIIPYVLPLVALGATFAAYQIAIQEIPSWNPIDFCGAGPNCANRIDIGLGPISLPMLSLAAFLFIFTMLCIGLKNRTCND